MMDRTRRVVRQARRRMLAADIVSRCGRWAIWGGCAGALAVLAAKVVDVPVSWPWLIGVPNLLALCGAAVVETVRPRPLLAAASAVDERLGLKSRLSNALGLDETFGADPFHALVAEEAEAASGRAIVARTFPIRFGRVWRPWPALVLASVAIALWVPHADLLGRRARLAAEHERARRSDALAREVSEAVNIAQATTPSDRVTGATAEQLRALTEIQQELDAGRADPKRAAEKAAGALNVLAEAQEKAADQAAIEQQAVRKALSELPEPADKPMPLSDALRDGDFARAAHDARSLAEAAQEDARQRASAAQQLEQLARDLRTLEERRQSGAESRQAAAPNGAADGSNRQGEPFSQALHDQLTQQGLNDAAQDALARPTNPEDAAKALKDAGLPPEPADRLARDIAQENQQRQAERDARQQARDLADAAEAAARQLREPPAQSPAAKQPAEKHSEQRSEKPGPKAPDRQPQQSDAREPKQSGEGNRQSQSSEMRQGQTQQPSAQPSNAQGYSPEPSDGQSRENPARQQSGESAQRQGEAEPKPDEQPRTGKSTSARQTPTSQPDAQARQQTGEHPHRTQDDSPSTQQNVPGPGERSPDQPAPDTNEKGAKRQRPGAMPAPGEQAEQSPRPGDQPPDADAVKRFADRLKEHAKGQDQTARDRQQARDLRERAERMLERMSPEQREQLRQWAHDAQHAPTQDATPGTPAHARSQPRSSDGGAGTESARITPVDPRAHPAPRTELVDARPRTPTDRTDQSHDQTVAQWLGSGTHDGHPGAGAAEAVVQDAVRSAERAIDDRTVPRRFDSLLERYFRRLPDAAKAGTRAGQSPSTQPAAQPASDAP